MAAEKIKIWVNDNRGHFLKLFRKELTDEFEFIVNPIFSFNSQIVMASFDHFVFVVYNKAELIDFLTIEKKGSIILVCLFNKRLYTNASFIEEINDLIVLDGYKTKRIIIKDLKLHLRESSGSKEQIAKKGLSNSYKNRVKGHNSFKTVFFLI
jgi:hypothetical protein